MADSFDKQFHAALEGCTDEHAREALSQILSVFKVVRRAREKHVMTPADVGAVLMFPRLFTFDLPNNLFWARNAGSLAPQLQLAVMDWIESALHAPTSEFEGLDGARRKAWVEAKEREAGCRATIYSFVVNAVMLSGGSVDGLRERLSAAMVA